MSTDVQWDGGFTGKKRQEMIHRRLFGFLLDGEGGDMNDDEAVFSWLTDTVGWRDLSEDEECIFASLVKALPKAKFNYETSFVYEGGGLDEMYHYIKYDGGMLSLRTEHVYETFDKNDDEEDDSWDEDSHVGRDIASLSCSFDINGNIIDDDRLSQKCLKLEKEQFSDILGLIEMGTDDPEALMDIVMIFETGLAAIDKNLTLAWNYYLKAAGTGDEAALEFVKKVFADDSREDLHELLANKCISRESYPVFFDLAVKVKNTELTAQLLEYKASLE